MLGDVCDSTDPASCTSARRFLPVLLSSLPFLLSFFLVATGVSKKVWPLLSGGEYGVDGREPTLVAAALSLPTHNYERDVDPTQKARRALAKPSVSNLTFSTNIALSAVLVELILCDISNTLDPLARSLVLKLTLPSLLVLLILVAPALEIYSLITAAGWSFTGSQKKSIQIAWLIEIVLLSCWLWLFWFLGKGLLGIYLHEESYVKQHSFSEGCLERIGVIGIALMASLAGFAAVSAVWQTWGAKNRPVTEADINRKQAGLAATEDMLQAKRSRLRALQRKMSESPSSAGKHGNGGGGAAGFLPRVVGSLRGNADVKESNTLRLEIAGLETVKMTLYNTLLSLQTRHREQRIATTPTGRVCTLTNYAFALYCAYRVASAVFNLSRHIVLPFDAEHPTTDPVTSLLALVAKHWDPTIDRAAWSRSISFLLSGFMLLASFSSALQTFLLLSRAFPALLRSALHANLALLVSQVSATYVISSALLLRSSLPDEVRGGISAALGTPLNVHFVGHWFEGWFLFAAVLTAAGIWAGRSWAGGFGEGYGDEDDEGDEKKS